MTRLAQSLVMLPYRRFCGKSVQGYRIEKCVGVGGSAVVFKAIAPDGGPVALKLLRPLRKTYDLQHVWREVEPLCRLSHAAIPAWQGIVRQGRAYFMVLSWMPGDALDAWLFEKRHRFERAELVKVALQLLDVLEALHAAGLAQADVRPANILYDGTRVSLIDFGLSGGPEDFALDIAGFADILIYLLYSTHDRPPAPRSKPATWREELLLEAPQRAFLSALIESPHALCIAEVRATFRAVFAAKIEGAAGTRLT